MMTLVLTACPVSLRGDLTKWLAEISPGVFVGNPSARVRDRLWSRTVELCREGRAILVYSANSEQGLAYKVHNHDWVPIDVDGLTLMLRPAERHSSQRRTGWSSARIQKRATRPSWRRSAPGADG
jgi:CRISPR-associated protein Cas2